VSRTNWKTVDESTASIKLEPLRLVWRIHILQGNQFGMETAKRTKKKTYDLAWNPSLFLFSVLWKISYLLSSNACWFVVHFYCLSFVFFERLEPLVLFECNELAKRLQNSSAQPFIPLSHITFHRSCSQGGIVFPADSRTKLGRKDLMLSSRIAMIMASLKHHLHWTIKSSFVAML